MLRTCIPIVQAQDILQLVLFHLWTFWGFNCVAHNRIINSQYKMQHWSQNVTSLEKKIDDLIIFAQIYQLAEILILPGTWKPFRLCQKEFHFVNSMNYFLLLSETHADSCTSEKRLFVLTIWSLLPSLRGSQAPENLLWRSLSVVSWFLPLSSSAIWSHQWKIHCSPQKWRCLPEINSLGLLFLSMIRLFAMRRRHEKVLWKNVLEIRSQ